jgi:hypothetical protein
MSKVEFPGTIHSQEALMKKKEVKFSNLLDELT